MWLSSGHLGAGGRLHHELEVSLGFVSPCLKTKISKSLVTFLIWSPVYYSVVTVFPVFYLILKCSVMKAGFLEGLIISICVTLTPGTWWCPLGTFPTGQLCSIYICLPEHSLSWKGMWPCLFPLVNSLVQGPPMKANRISWMVAALDGWSGQQSYIIYFVICMALSPPPCTLQTSQQNECGPERQQLCLAISDSLLEPRQFCWDYHKIELKAEQPRSEGADGLARFCL
jgi:hypothetical protein